MVVEQDKIRCIPKFNSASNYRARLAIITSFLRSYLLWDIMSDVEVMPLMSDKPGDKTSKTSGYQKPGFSTIIADIT